MKTFNQLNFFPTINDDLCAMENIKNIEEAILTYSSAWNETAHEVILEKIKECWAPDGTYTDKLTDTIIGSEAITDLIISSYGQMGPRIFTVLSQPDTHHQSGRFGWLAIRPEGYPVPGMDYLNLMTRIVSHG